MKIYFSKSKLAFYNDDIHPADAIPSDAIVISGETHSALMDAQTNGKIISVDKNGYPIAVDPPAPTPEQQQASQNAKARKYLSSTDWYVTRFAETGAPIPEDIKTSRQNARDSIVE